MAGKAFLPRLSTADYLTGLVKKFLLQVDAKYPIYELVSDHKK